LGDALLVATGRQAVTDLGLAAAGVHFDEHGLTVDDRLRTSNRRIYAAGDVCSRYRFTHAAEALARTALQNALFFGRKKASALLIPWCTYTSPQIAHVGVGQGEANARGMVTYTAPFSEVDRAIIDGSGLGFARIHVSPNGKIHGATVVSDGAGELIAEVVLAMDAKLTLAQLGASIRPYPTRAEVWKQLADKRARERLTPRLRWLFQSFLRLRR
ncbi:MAG TPA: FAD-dependent oxidoreductase, partial [Polyangiaceae bacterium]|nr:FAD-dependent oxidoreductase [Polyangiaceae bacterium]